MIRLLILCSLFIFIGLPVHAENYQKQQNRMVLEKYGIVGLKLQKYITHAEKNQMKAIKGEQTSYKILDSDQIKNKNGTVTIKNLPSETYCRDGNILRTEGSKTIYDYVATNEQGNIDKLHVVKTFCNGSWYDMKSYKMSGPSDCSDETTINLYKNDKLIYTTKDVTDFFIYKNDLITENTICGMLGLYYTRYNWKKEELWGQNLLERSLDDVPAADPYCLSDGVLENGQNRLKWALDNDLDWLLKLYNASSREEIEKKEADCQRIKKNNPTRLKTCQDEIILENGMNVLEYRQKYDADDFDPAETKENEECHQQKRERLK